MHRYLCDTDLQQLLGAPRIQPLVPLHPLVPQRLQNAVVCLLGKGVEHPEALKLQDIAAILWADRQQGLVLSSSVQGQVWLLC